jgi:hypothetical protein
MNSSPQGQVRLVIVGGIALQLDVTDRLSIAVAAEKPQGIRPPRPVGSERCYLEYQEGQLFRMGAAQLAGIDAQRGEGVGLHSAA